MCAAWSAPAYICMRCKTITSRQEPQLNQGTGRLVSKSPFHTFLTHVSMVVCRVDLAVRIYAVNESVIESIVTERFSGIFPARPRLSYISPLHPPKFQPLPRPSKGLRFGTPIECSLRGYVSTPLSGTKKTQQDMVITMLIAPFLGEMVGDELNNKNFDFGKFRRAHNTRLPGRDTLPTSIKGCQNDTP